MLCWPHLHQLRQEEGHLLRQAGLQAAHHVGKHGRVATGSAASQLHCFQQRQGGPLSQVLQLGGVGLGSGGGGKQQGGFGQALRREGREGG